MATIVIYILIAIGLLLFIIPGIFLGLSFFFYTQEIAVEDKGPIKAMAGSWSLAKGHRFEILGLGVILFAISIGAVLLNGLIGNLAPILGLLAGFIIGPALAVFNSAVVAQAYRQLRAESHEDTSNEDTSSDDDAWDPDDEWNDPPM